MIARAVLDINVLLSALIGPLGQPRLILTAWAAGQFTLIGSEHIVSGVAGKALSPDLLRRFLTLPAPARHIETVLRTTAELVIVPPGEVRAVTGDPDDDTVLATARLSRAAYLVSDDRGLLALGSYEGARIVIPRQFLSVLDD